MTTEYQAKLLDRIVAVSTDIETLRKVEMEIASSGTASATLSGAGGARSYTRLDLDKVEKLIRLKETELANLRNRLNGGGAIRRIFITR